MLRVTQQRLVNQQLVTPVLGDPTAVVARLGAVQSQDYAGAKWGIAQRTVGATDATVERAIVDGSIVRTHILRPTWHFVAAADIRWMLALSAPRVKAACAYRWRTLELDEALFRRSNTALVKALRDSKQLTRTEIASAFQRAKIDITSAPERLTHLMMRAELDGIVCNGLRRGKQFTYALFDERVPDAKPISRQEALVELAKRYFTTRGPATAHDFAWWSGLTVTDAKLALADLDDDLEHETLDGTTYWFADMPPSKPPRSTAWLLPNYDEYFIAFADRGAMLERVARWRDGAANAFTFSNTIVVDGQVVGAWRRTTSAKGVTVHLEVHAPLKPAERRSVSIAVERFGSFLGVPTAQAG